MKRYNDAFDRQDIDDLMAALIDDCVFKSPGPQPNGARFVGATAVRAVWEEFFANSPDAVFDTEDLRVNGDTCVYRWLYRWVGDDGAPGHVSGVDILRVRDGKVAEKFAYVKG